MKHDISTVSALLFAMLFAVGCGKDNGGVGTSPLDPALHITVTTSIAGSDFSRGVPISTQDEMNDFGLFCTYTGGEDWTPDTPIEKMFDEQLVKNHFGEGHYYYWTYAGGDPVRWETGPGTTANDRYTFFAYAPYWASSLSGISVIDPADVESVLGKDVGRPHISYIVPQIFSNHPDLMIAARRENVRPTGNPVSLQMYHALSAVGFRVVGSGEQIASIAVTGYCDRGVVELDGDDLAWDMLRLDGSGTLLSSPLASAPLTDSWLDVGLGPGAVASPGGDVMGDDGWLMMIPQTLTSKAKVRITFSDGTPERIYNLYNQQWIAGKQVTYTIRLSD